MNKFNVLLFLVNILVSNHLMARKIQWNCPLDNYLDLKTTLPQKEVVDISIDDEGHVIFRPDIFSQKLGKILNLNHAYDYSECFEDFKAKFEGFSDDEKVQIESSLSKTYFNKINFSKNSYKRYFLGMSFSKKQDYQKSIKRFCNSDPLRSDAEFLNKEFVEYITGQYRYYNNPFSSIECLRKYEEYLTSNIQEKPCENSSRRCEDLLKRFENSKNIVSEFTISIAEKEMNSQTKLLKEYKISQMPPGYNVNKFLDGLRSGNCSFRHSDLEYNELIIALAKESSGVPKNCIENVLQYYIFKRSRLKQMLSDDFCQKHECDFLKGKLQEFNSALETLVENLYGESGIALYCSKQTLVKDDFSEVKKLISQLDQAVMCEELDVGETRVVSNSLTSVSANYFIKKKSKDVFQIDVPINFINAKDNTFDKDMFNRVKSCLESSSKGMRVKNQSFEINIINKEEYENYNSTSKPRLNSVNVKDNYFRANAGNYPRGIECPAITHEVLHLLGLCDEYKESLNGAYFYIDSGKEVSKDEKDLQKLKDEDKVIFKASTNECRSHASTSSVMKNHVERFQEAMGGHITCSCSSPDCKKLFEHDAQLVTKMIMYDPMEGIEYGERCKYRSKNIKKLSQTKDFQVLSQNINLISNSDKTLELEYDKIALGRDEGYSSYLTKTSISCDCTKNKFACDKIRQNLKTQDAYIRRFCPWGMETNKPINFDHSSEKVEAKYENDLLSVQFPPQSDISLLHPAHFERIKWGGCSSKATFYTKCAKYAYNAYAKNCPDRPKICDEDEKWLLESK